MYYIKSREGELFEDPSGDSIGNDAEFTRTEFITKKKSAIVLYSHGK